MDTQTHKKKVKIYPLGWVFIIIVLLVIAGGGYYGITHFVLKPANPDLGLPQIEMSQTELLQKVGQLYDLPQGETPSIAQIPQDDSVKKQAFFQKAQPGDVLIVYTKAKLAIIYRPTTNKIINVAPINLSKGPAVPTTQAASSSAEPSGEGK